MADYPELPPGVKTFDPRRFRRYRKEMGLAADRARLAQETKVAEAEKRAVLRALAEERRRTNELEKELEKERAPRPGILKRAMGLFRRRP